MLPGASEEVKQQVLKNVIICFKYTHNERICFQNWKAQGKQLQFASAFLMCPGDLELGTLHEDRGVSCTVIEDMLPLNKQFTSGALWGNRRKCVRFLQDLVAAAVLRPHGADFPLQLLDFAHAWSERRDSDIHMAAAVFLSKKILGGHKNLGTDLLAAIAGFLAGWQPHNAPTLHTARTTQQITRAEFRTLEVLSYERANPTPAAWIEICERRLSLW